MSNINLSANINVRMTLDVKKKLMDEADRREMNMSEYVIFILETTWNKLNESSEPNNEILQLREDLAKLNKALHEAQIQELNSQIKILN